MISLRINQSRTGFSLAHRIVGRAVGNQRVLINSQIFPDMIVEKVSNKRVKFSATVPESEVPVLFLATVRPSSGFLNQIPAGISNYA
ncbi:unnamed protein product [Gongylonema pulchrum]|uniref:30S ribosomal protein S9 n=1 Tax=Gongylonema pulchrum TaxID=637853 RepID=A0A183ECZ1_9BILA|nr:unnamed protein product [Gongylonema pulchrum]